jgi:hypothetical protein
MTWHIHRSGMEGNWISSNSQEQMTRGGLSSLKWLAHRMSRNLKRKYIGIDTLY